MNNKRKIYYEVVIKLAPSVVISVYSFLDYGCKSGEGSKNTITEFNFSERRQKITPITYYQENCKDNKKRKLNTEMTAPHS